MANDTEWKRKQVPYRLNLTRSKGSDKEGGNKVKRRWIRLGMIIIMGWVAGYAGPNPAFARPPLSLGACVKRAIRYNNTLRSYASQRRSVAMEVKQALAPFYPTLSFETTFERQDWEDAPRDNQTEADFRASYNLFHGGGDWSTLQSKQHRYRASVYDLQEESLTVVASVEDTFFAILSLENRLEVLRKSVEAAALHEKYARERMEAGLAPRSDYLRAQVDLANARVDLVQAKRNMNTLKHTLNILMGVSPAQPLTLKKGPVILKAGKMPLKELFALAAQNRPILKSYQQQILELKWEERSVKASFFPTLDTFIRAGRTGEETFPDRNNWSVGLELQYPFFSGFSTRYAAESTRAKLESQRWLYHQKILEVQKEIADAYAQFKTDERIITAREALLKSALENLKVARRRYEVGVGSIVELTDARVDATKAAIGLENAKLTVLGDEIELRRTTGWFLPLIKSLEDKAHAAKTLP